MGCGEKGGRAQRHHIAAVEARPIKKTDRQGDSQCGRRKKRNKNFPLVTTTMSVTGEVNGTHSAQSKSLTIPGGH